jgi:hypothetical protein
MMSLADVKDEYVKEQVVLQAWKTRMNHVGPISEPVTPESQMSSEYKQGWTFYLNQVLSISARMIAACEQAQQSGGGTTALKQLLNDEAAAYTAMADEAAKHNLPELCAMLKHEASSRILIIGEL